MRPIAEIRVDQDELISAPAPVRPAPFSDIPAPIWKAFLGTWALLFGLFLVFFSTDGRATMAVVTACFFAIMMLGLPTALGMQTHTPPKRSNGIVQTNSGPIPVRAAATQILLIPVGSVIGLVTLIILTK